MKKIFYLGVMTALFAVGCSKKENNNTPVTDKKEAVKVKIETAAKQEVEQIYEFTSTVEPSVKNFITSAGGTRIEKIYVEVGQYVKKGQKLVTMENTNLATAKFQLADAKNNVDRMEALYKSGGCSKQQLDQLKTQYEVSKRNIENIEDNITLKSPINGIITQRNFDNGDVSANQPILQVMQISPVKLKFSINEAFYAKVKTGMAVKAKVEVFGEEVFGGKISLISPTIDPNTRTFMVEADFTNNNQKLRPGMFGRVELNLGKANSIVVPDMAIIKQNGTNDKYVFVVNNGVAKNKKIILGRRLGDKYEVISGIEEGESVVINGNTRLIDGSKVEIVK